MISWTPLNNKNVWLKKGSAISSSPKYVIEVLHYLLLKLILLYN